MRGRSRLLRRNEAGEGRVEERATEQQGETVRKETQRGTWEQGMTEVHDGVTEGYEGVGEQGVAEGYEGVGEQRVAEGYEGVGEQRVAEVYEGVGEQGVAEGYEGVGEQRVAEGYEGVQVQGVAEGYEGVGEQRVAEGYEGVQVQGVAEEYEGVGVQGVAEGYKGVGVQGVAEGYEGVQVQGVAEEYEGVEVQGVAEEYKGVGVQGVAEEYEGVGVQVVTEGYEGVGEQGYEVEAKMRGVQGEIELQGDTEGQEIKGQRGPRSPVPSSPGSDGVLSQVGVNGVHGRQKVADRPLGCLPVQELGAVSDSRQYAQLLAADSGAEMEDLENSIEDMLVRLDEFCAMMDMIRNETSHILEEKIPALTIKVEEMNKIYSRVDKLEAFVKMVGHHVTFLEEEVAQAESDHLSFPQALNRMIQGAPIPLLLRVNGSRAIQKDPTCVTRTVPECRIARYVDQARGSLNHSLLIMKKASKPPKSYELPKLYRTEDYFPPHYIYVKNEKSYQILPSGL